MLLYLSLFLYVLYLFYPLFPNTYLNTLAFSRCMKETISSFELFHLVNEFKILVGGKIEKVFQQTPPSPEFLLTIHVPNQEKKQLYIHLPGLICLANFKPEFPSSPPHFCQALRRKIQGSYITAVQQVGFERILKISLETKHGSGSLFIELYSSGNIIYVDEEHIILAVYHQKIWNEQRKILHKQIYSVQNSLPQLPQLSLQEFFNVLTTSTKDQLVTSLAIDFGLGGQFAQEILHRANVDSSLLPSSCALNQATLLFNTIKELLDYSDPGIFQKDIALPFLLESLVSNNESFSSLWESKESFNDAIASLTFSLLSNSQKSSSHNKKASSLSKSQIVIAKQEKQLRALEISEKENQEKGELIYLYYQEIQTLLSEVNKLKKTLSWSQVKKELSSLPYLKEINEHQGTITIDIKQGDKS